MPQIDYCIIFAPENTICFLMNNILCHTKHFAFHAAITTGVYAVGFDMFVFSPRPRRHPLC